MIMTMIRVTEVSNIVEVECNTNEKLHEASRQYYG